MAYETESPLINGASNNSTQTANPLTSGVTMVAALGAPTDRDYFAINTGGAAAINLIFATDVISSTNNWQVRLLDGNGDYLQTVVTSNLGAPVVATAVTTAANSLDVSGLTALPAAGSRFTISTSAADTTIYTVVSATPLSSGASTLTLDKNITATLASTLVFDPAQLVTAGSTQISAQVAAAGKYYVQVLSDDVVWSGNDYRVTATVQPTTEVEGNDTKADAVESNNRLLANTTMTGALSSATDIDYWLFTTAAGSDFKVAFAAATGSASSNQWKIDVTALSGSVLLSSSGGNGALTAGTAASVDISQVNYSGPTSFMVKVSATSPSVYNTGNYTLKVSGATLDLNDAPVLTIGTVSSSTPDAVLSADTTGVVKNISASSTGTLLSSFFSVSDPDSGQSIDHYIVSLSKAPGTTSSAAYIHSAANYGFGGTDPQLSGQVTLTAAQMATATFVPGATTGDLLFTVQAFDSTGALDH